MTKVYIYDFEPTNERLEQIELEIIEGQLTNPWEDVK